MKKKRLWKRLLAGFMAAAVVCTSAPQMNVMAVDQNLIKMFDFNKMYSTSRGEYIAGFFNQPQTAEAGAKNYLVGEFSYVEYSLAYNSPVRIELYSVGENGTTLLGPVYGKEYMNHVQYNSATGKYEVNPVELSSLKDKLEIASRDVTNYHILNNVQGISLTGAYSAYNTLSEYYSFYGLPLPSLNLEDDLEEETTADETMPENNMSLSQDNNLSEDLNDDVTLEMDDTDIEDDTFEEFVEEQSPEDQNADGNNTETEENNSEDTSIDDAEEGDSQNISTEDGVVENGGNLEQSSELEDTTSQENSIDEDVNVNASDVDGQTEIGEEKIIEADVTTHTSNVPLVQSAQNIGDTETLVPESSEVEVEEGDGDNLQSEVREQDNVSDMGDAPPVTDIEEDEETVETEDASEEVKDKETTETEDISEEAGDEEIAETENISEELEIEETTENTENIPSENVANSEEEILDSSNADETILDSLGGEYPDDYFLQEPDYAIETMDIGPTPTGIIHNYFVWCGQYYDSLTGSQVYAPPGNYEIRITPTYTSQQNLIRKIPFTIVGGEGGSEVTNEDILRMIIQEREIFPNLFSGFPSLRYVYNGDPVDLLSGALRWSYQDLLVEGKEPLQFERTYVSSLRNRNDFGLGNGWTHTYSYFADIYSSDVKVILPEGGAINFSLSFDESYSADDGNEYSLIKDGDGFILSSDRGKTIWFNGDGRATKIEESDGTITTLENSGDKLTKVSTDTGSFSFTYDGDRLVSVTDNSGRSVAFGYSGTDLTTVTNPDIP